MKLTSNAWLRALKGVAAFLAASALASIVLAQSFSTTTVQGTVYLANGAPGAGTLQLSWPAFTTANNQAVAAGRTTATIGTDGFVSVNLAPNLGATPAGLFYTGVYNMNNGTTSTEYWVVPAAAQANIAQVRAQVMPAAQAVQAVNKAYVDQAIESLSQSYLAPSGGSLTGPLYLSGDPTQSMQAADKHYVDSTFSQAVPLTGASLTGPLTSVQLGAAYQVDQFPGTDFGAKLQACLSAVTPVNGGTCDARNFTGTQSMASNLAISTPNTTIQLPCATISTASQLIVTAGTRNVSLHGCALRGASNASGSQGGTVFLYSGTGSMIQVGDPTYASDTSGFHLDNVVINTTSANNSSAEGLIAYRTQEMDLESLYLLGNSNQTGMTLDGTGNYTGGTFYDNAVSGFQTAVNAIGHQISNSATTDWLNASTFVRLHIDCPTSNGTPISGTFGINLQQGDGNTFTGGDVEGCNTALHLGSNAQNNTIVGLRNENSSIQVAADSGSAYNNWITGGTMFTGKLTDNGTRNSFLDTFHRSFNGINGDWYGSQQDATVTNHYRLGIGSGLERGFLDRYQTDYGYRWTTGLSDATAGEQFYQVLDELNNVYRLSIGQYNNGQSSTNNQTVVNAAGTGAVVLNGSNNSGTGGVVFGSGGPSEATVAMVNNVGNAQFNGTLQVGGTSTFAGSTTTRNQADAEIDSFLWAGTTANQKESFTYKDYTGVSQWYMVKDTSNNWALNSASGGLDSIKAYQSTNSGDTYIDASNSSGVVRVNYESGSGSQFKVYGGNSSTPYASFTGATSIQFPGLAAATGHNCLQVDNSGYLSNTGSVCGSGTGNGTVNSGASGQIAYYSSGGTALSGLNIIPVTAGGTGATSAGGALASLGGASLTSNSTQNFSGPVSGPAVVSSVNSQVNVMAPPFNAKGDCVTDDQNAIQEAMTAAATYNPPAVVYFPKPPGGCYLTSTLAWNGSSLQGQPGLGTSYNTAGVSIQGKPGQDVFEVPSPSTVSTVAPNRTWSIRDLRITVDDTAAGNFPHRWPGRWVSDASMSAGSATFASSNSMMTCGDIGQAILVKGAGASGADLSTTIANVTPCWATSHAPTSQIVTLASPASATTSAGRAYISAANLPVTATVGACGIAFDDIDGNQADNTMTGPVGNLYDTMRDVSFNSVGGGYGKNSTCALYFQGWWGPYGLDARNVNIGGVYYGVVESSSESNSFDSTGGNDFQKWDHGIWSATYPWISYNGADNKLEDIQLQSVNGPQVLQFGNTFQDAALDWYIDMPEFGHPAGSVVAWRIEGSAHTLVNTNLAEDYTYTQPIVFDANESQCINCSVIGAMALNGGHNRFTLTSDSSYQRITDAGVGNVITGSFHVSPLYGYPDSRFSAINISRGDKAAGTMTSDFVRTGNLATPYMSDLDLMFWPDDFAMNGSFYPPSVSTDANSLTGKYLAWYQNVTVNKFTSAAYLNDGGIAPIGSKMIPATQATVSVSTACPAIASFTFTVLAGTSSMGSSTFPCSPTYTTSSLAVDMSSFSGSALGFYISGTGSSGPASGVNVAYISISPYNAGLNMSGPINFGTSSAASSTLANMGGQVAMPGVNSDGSNGLLVKGNISGRALNGMLNEASFPGSTLAARVQAACASLSGASGVVMIPATETSTDSGYAVEPVGCVIEDHRGFIFPNQYSATKLPAPRVGVLRRSFWNTAPTGDWSGTFVVDNVAAEAVAGGQNTYNGSSGVKTDYAVRNTNLYSSTPGEHSIENQVISNFSPGDTYLRGAQIYDTGWSTAVGDEGLEGDTIYLEPGQPALTATVSSISSNALTMVCGSNCGQLGEQQPIVNTSRNVQSTGTATISTTNPPVVTISGGSVTCPGGTNPCSSNTQGGVGLFFEFTGEAFSGHHIVMPIIAVDSTGTQLTLLVQASTNTSGPVNDLWLGYTTSGAYNVYQGTTVTTVPYTAGVYSTIYATVADPTQFQVGDGIMVPGGNNRLTQGVTRVILQNVPSPEGSSIFFGQEQGHYTQDWGVHLLGGFRGAPFQADWSTNPQAIPLSGVTVTGATPSGGYFSGTDFTNLTSTEKALCTGTNSSGNLSCIQFYRTAGATQNYWQIPNVEFTGQVAFDNGIPLSGNVTNTPTATGQGFKAVGYSTYSSDYAEMVENGGTAYYQANENVIFDSTTGSATLKAPQEIYIDGGNGGYGVQIGTQVSGETIQIGASASSTKFLGSNKFGSAQQTVIDANGVKHEAGSSPTTSAGTITGTNAGGYIAGLSAATSVTITFANSGWNTWASCTANATVSGSQPYVTSSLGLKTSVTFTFPSAYTGGITYSCAGN